MHKELLVLGLLLSGPLSGYDVHRIVTAHGALYSDLKKGNVYYLLERLAAEGGLHVVAEAGARGPRRERLVYALTDHGCQMFGDLLREVVRGYTVAHTGIEVGMVFLSYLSPTEAIHLLEERRQMVVERRQLVERATEQLHEQLAQDHLVSLMDAELGWIERSVSRLQELEKTSVPPQQPTRCPGTSVEDC
ncbi:MAG: helix-turn-helix transcriptional regulator [Ktedonobacterales bacterium]|nr:helix-turn-helix transcriptional regulator [Ktedonobacterales bacterium]